MMQSSSVLRAVLINYSTKLHHKLWWSVVEHGVCSTTTEIAGVELLHHSAPPQLVVESVVEQSGSVVEQLKVESVV